VKKDIDHLMDETGLDALVVMGSAQHNPYMTYLVGLAHLTDALVVKKRNAEPVLVHRSMERGEAEKSGMERVLFESYGSKAYLDRGHGDPLKAKALRLADVLQDCGVDGSVALYGRMDMAVSHPLLVYLQGAMPGVEWVREEGGSTVLDRARLTKDPREIERIRHMGQVTTDIVGAVADYLTRQRASNGFLADADGEAITIGQVKARIRQFLAERNAEASNGLIFSAGHDSALPHSIGEDNQPLPIGQTIIFDIYPAEAGGGYFHDFTRTWCLGSPQEDVQAVYRDVRQVYERFLPTFKAGKPTHTYQVDVCEAFEALGHPSLLSDEKTQSGYVHGLGHGLGLSVHEPPSFRTDGEGSLPIAPGMVFTFEPGLYYPDKDIGVRIEDTLVVDDDGTIHPLVDHPKDLVLPVAGS
jgi:Xaa-Pro aminopeptidase